MAQTLCIKCGSELKVSSYCQLCQEPLIFACTSCDYITEEKVHTDCRNAEVLVKTESKATPPHTTGSSVDKPKEEETVKAESMSAPPYMTREQDKENNNNDLNNPNPLVAASDNRIFSLSIAAAAAVVAVASPSFISCGYMC
jgi:hypothetical protein